MGWISLLVACSDYNLHHIEPEATGEDTGGAFGPGFDDGGLADGGVGSGRSLASEGGDTGDVDVDDVCRLAANLTGYLDDFQTPEDGKVVFCHSGSGEDYVLVDSDVDACSAHVQHRWDVFPTTGCDS
ncbi:MAG: hypothetical protein ACOZNI_03150 [Myxococcota bacterium]